MFVFTALKIYRRMHLTYDSIRKHHKVLGSKDVLEVIVETYFHGELPRRIRRRAYVDRKLIIIYRIFHDADRDNFETICVLKQQRTCTVYLLFEMARHK